MPKGGCVPKGGYVPSRVSAQRGVCPGGLSKGVCLPGGVCVGGLPRGVSAQGGLPVGVCMGDVYPTMHWGSHTCPPGQNDRCL